MVRVVLDTNILVSIALPESRFQSLVPAWQKGQFRLLISQEIFEEYLRVLTYPKFRLTQKEILRLVEKELRPYAELVNVTSRLKIVSADPTDDKFLECAVDGHATWIITGDRHLLDLKTFRRTRIGSPAQFLDFLDKK